MNYILNIDTASDQALVCLSKDGKLAAGINGTKEKHTSFLHPAIQSLLAQVNITSKDLKAISVTEGPGSYTGLRIGMSTAKGLCYSLNIPLITVNSLHLLAHATRKIKSAERYVAMIDARRMEVFSAVYDKDLNTILPPTSFILKEDTYKDLISNYKPVFCGNGTEKYQTIIEKIPAESVSFPETGESLCELAFEKLLIKDFNDLYYSEPLYVKPFYDNKLK